MMNKTILTRILVAATIFLGGCEMDPYVKHSASIEQVNPDCNAVPAGFRMISNIGGERFEFARCLPGDFNEESLDVSRQGDTVIVRFPPPGTSGATFNVVLDIDSYPRYNFITIDDETFAVIPSAN